MRPNAECRMQKAELKILRRISFFSLSCFLWVVFLGFPLAEAEGTEEFKEVTGEVASVRADLITVEFHRADGVSKEIRIPLDAQLGGSLGRIKPGDTVTVQFKDSYIEDGEGKRSGYKRTATQVSLVRTFTGNSLDSRKTRRGKIQVKSVNR